MTPVLAAERSARRAAVAACLEDLGHAPRIVEDLDALRDQLDPPRRELLVTADPWASAASFVQTAQAARVPSLVLWPADSGSPETDDVLARVEAVLTWPAPASRLDAALRAVAAGLQVFDPRTGRPSPGRFRTPSAPAGLSRRERAILSQVAAGTSNKRIARVLGVSPETVKFHMRTIFRKLNVVTRAEAVAEALRLGEVDL